MCTTFGFRFCKVNNSWNVLALFPGLPCFCSLICVHHRSGRAVKNGEGLGTHHVNDVRWMQCECGRVVCDYKYVHNELPVKQEYLVSCECLGSCQVTKHMMM